MAKTKRATRKELETVVGKLIQEVQFLRQGFTALDNYVGAYVKYKGDTITFNDFLTGEVKKMQKDIDAKEGSTTSDKKSRYKKVSTPVL